MLCVRHKEPERSISAPSNIQPNLGITLCHDSRCCITPNLQFINTRIIVCRPHFQGANRKQKYQRRSAAFCESSLSLSLFPPHSTVFPWYSTRNAFDLKTRGCCQMTVNTKWKEPWDAASCPPTMRSSSKCLTEQTMNLRFSAESRGSSAGVFS